MSCRISIESKKKKTYVTKSIDSTSYHSTYYVIHERQNVSTLKYNNLINNPRSTAYSNTPSLHVYTEE